MTLSHLQLSLVDMAWCHSVLVCIGSALLNGLTDQGSKIVLRHLSSATNRQMGVANRLKPFEERSMIGGHGSG